MEIGEAKLWLARIIRSAKPADRVAGIRQLSLMEGWDAPTRLEHTGANGEPLFDVSKLNDDQLIALEGILAAIAGGGAVGEGVSPPEGQLN